MLRLIGLLLGLVLSVYVSAQSVMADERHFTYSYEADVLPQDGLEFEQWITSRSGRDGGRYGRWEFREELEYGITDALTTALYLNFLDTTFSPDDPSQEETKDFEFNGISSEWKYLISNPELNPVGFLVYGEATYDSDFFTLEEKLVLSSNLSENLIAELNVSFEQEWEYEGSDTEKVGEFEVTGGLAYKLSPHWSAGVEIRNIREFDSFDFDHELENAWYAGPNLHYGTANWWATLTVMPQIGVEGSRDLEDQEKVHVRLIVGRVF